MFSHIQILPDLDDVVTFRKVRRKSESSVCIIYIYIYIYIYGHAHAHKGVDLTL